MPAAIKEKIDLVDLKLSKNPEDFSKVQIGGLYFEPDTNFEEVQQGVLKSLIVQSKAFNKTSPYAEFIPDDILLEESFYNLIDAKKFVRNTFAKFKMAKSYNKVDIINKLTFFYSFFKLKKINCRFEVLSGNSCKKFHCDHVKARLICTYAGPGTQVKLPEEEKIVELPSGSTLITKGTRFPGFQAVSLHRSPPIEDTGAKRFLFIADFS
jgi:hypothetical protein